MTDQSTPSRGPLLQLGSAIGRYVILPFLIGICVGKVGIYLIDRSLSKCHARPPFGGEASCDPKTGIWKFEIPRQQ